MNTLCRRWARSFVALALVSLVLSWAPALGQNAISLSAPPPIFLPQLRLGADGTVYAPFSGRYIPLLNAAGGTLSGPMIGQSGGTAISSIHTLTPPYGPADGFALNPSGMRTDYCSFSGCLPGPHLLGEFIINGTTHADASAQESIFNINLSNSTGAALYYTGPGMVVALGQQIHAGTGQDIYQVTTAGVTTSAGGPNFCPGLASNPQCSAPASQTNASTGTDGTAAFVFVGAGINDGKSGVAIAAALHPGGGHMWAQSSSIVVDPGVGAIPIFNYEFDTTNNNLNYDIGVTPPALPIFINGYNAYRLTAAIGVFTGGSAANKAFQDGVLFNGDNQIKQDTFADATSAQSVFHCLGAPHTHDNCFKDDSNSDKVLVTSGTHRVGLELSYTNFTSAIAVDFSASNYIAFSAGTQLLGYNGASGCLTYGTTNSGTAYAFESCNNGFFGIAGHLFSRGNAPTVTGVGCSGTVLQVGSTDLSGTIIEGNSCTGASLTFAQAGTNVDPFCVVMPWNGSGTPLTAYNGGSSAFSYAHASASGQKFSYHCMAQ